MKTHLALILGALTLAASAHATSPTTAGPSKEQRCAAYANEHYKSIQPTPVSGTTLSYTYNATTGFCTVQVDNRNPNNSFHSRVSTNMLEDTPRMNMHVETVTSPLPVHLKWQPAPHRLLCSKVTTGKNGEQICTPYKPAPDAFPLPFFDDDM